MVQEITLTNGVRANESTNTTFRYVLIHNEDVNSCSHVHTDAKVISIHKLEEFSTEDSLISKYIELGLIYIKNN